MTYAEGSVGGVGPDHSQPGWRAGGLETAELTHEEVRSQLSDYLAGELDETQEARVAGHLGGCPTCAAFVATLRRTVDLVRSLPTRTAPRALRERLRAIPGQE